MQLIPAIDLRDGKCVRLRQGDYNQETIFGEDPLAMARRWVEAGGERLHLVDLDGAKAGRPVNLEIVRKIVATLGVPCQMGGGVRSDAIVRELIEDVGLDRVIIGTQALKQPDWFQGIVERFPGKVALGLDARNSMVATEGWLDVSSTSALELAKRYVGLPLAAVIYTNIANDGMMQGVDENTIQDMLRLAAMGLPVIASGGVTTLMDVTRLTVEARTQPKLIGAIIGRALYEGTIDLSAAVAVSKER